MNGFVFVPKTQSNGIFSIFNRQDRVSAFNFSQGDTLTATLIERDGGKAVLRTDTAGSDFTFSVSWDSIKGETGDTLNFKVIRNDESGLALRQIFAKAGLLSEAAIKRGDVGIDDIKQVAKTLEQKNEEAEYKTDYMKEQNIKTAQAVAQVRRSQRFMSDNSSRAAISAIIASGLDLHKVSFFTVNNVVKEIEALPDSLLYNSGENINNEKYSSELKKVQDLLTVNLSEDAIANLLKTEKEITPSNVYAGRYGYVTVPKENPGPSKLDSLDEQIIKRFNNEGIENTPKNLDAARFLLSKDLPVNKYNIEAAILLKSLDSIPREILAAHIADAVSQGEDPANIKLMQLLPSLSSVNVDLDILKKLPYIKPEDVQTVMETKNPLDLKHLTEVKPEQAILYPVKEQEVIKSQRQLAEIQLKMTVQAAFRLAGKGIAIDTTPLSKLVAHLRTLEIDTHARHLRAVQAADSPQNVAKMDDIFRAVREIRPFVFNINGNLNIQAKVFTRQVDFTLQGMHKLAAEQYESSATVPNSRYGDSFGKLTGQFEEFLKKLGIEPTAENLRAAAILSRNNTDVNPSNIDGIKTIDAKITAVMDRLHPMMAAQMLKEGLMPLNMHMDEMLAYIRKYEDIFGYSGRNKIAQYIYEMDKNKALQPTEREGIIAVYRMLNLIQKNGAAALGLAFKQDAPLTLGSLMEAAKFYDRKKTIDVFAEGHLASAAKPGDNIRAAIANAVPLSYTDLLADSLIDKGSPDKLKEWMGNTEKPVEDILQQTTDVFKPDIQQAAQAMRQFAETPPTLIALLQNSGILPASDNLRAARRLADGSFAEKLKDLLNEIDSEEFLADKASFDSVSFAQKPSSRREVLENLWKALDNAIPTEAIREAKSLIEIQYALAENDEDLEIPLLLNDKFASLKMYTLNEDAMATGNLRTFLSITTEQLGNVQSYFTIEENQISLQFTANNPAAKESLEANAEMLKMLIEDIGYDVADLTITYSAAKEPALLPEGREMATEIEDIEPLQLELSDYEFMV